MVDDLYGVYRATFASLNGGGGDGRKALPRASRRASPRPRVLLVEERQIAVDLARRDCGASLPLRSWADFVSVVIDRLGGGSKVREQRSEGGRARAAVRSWHDHHDGDRSAGHRSDRG